MTDAPETCSMCKKAIEFGTGAMVDEVQPDGTKKAYHVHELCFLKGDRANMQMQVANLGLMLAAALHQAGGTVRVPLKTAQEVLHRAGAKFGARQEGADLVIWVGEENRVVLATSVPKVRA